MYKKHDQRYFAMLNNAVAVTDTSLEGGNRTEVFEYYLYLLDYPDCPLSLQLSKDEEAAIKKGVRNLAEANGIIQQYFKENAPPEGAVLEKALTTLINFVNRESAKTGTCYLPSGWKGDPAGHYVSMKCRRLPNGNFAFSLLNQGEGMQYHRNSKKKGSKDRRLYQSEEYEVDLNSPNGREFLQHICELMTLTEHEHDYDADWKGAKNRANDYSALDLYGILKLYGKERPLDDKLDQKGVTPQRSGTCSCTNTHAVARDILVDLGADLKKRKRFHFILKLRSLLDAYEAYQQGNCDLNVLEWALREFYVRCNKEYKHVLNSEEMIYCGELETKIRTRLETDKKARLDEQCKQEVWPDSEGEGPPDLMMVLKEKKKTSKKKNDEENEKKHEYPPLTPENFLEILENKIKNHELNEIHEKYHFFQSLPHCSGQDKDEFWDRVPRGHIPNIVNLFGEMFWNLRHDPERGVVVSLTMYDIVAQLITDKTHTPGLDDVYSELNLFSDPVIYYNVKRIVKNFETRSQGKKRVLTNQVEAQGSSRDDTVFYLLHVILDDERRDRVSKMVRVDGKDDFTLFAEIMKMLDGPLTDNAENRELKKNLGETFLNLIKISGLAHGHGNPGEKYTQDDHSPYYRFNFKFHVPRFYAELKRKKELQRAGSPVVAHLPVIRETDQKSGFRDYSENTLYGPENKSPTKIRSQFNNDKTSDDPYQHDLSGSLNPDSKVWKLDEKNRRVFEELNEEFRHLACSPHLQIGRTLHWLKKNPDKIIYNEVKIRIRELLFQYGLLDQALTNDATLTLTQVKDCIASLLKYCREEPIQDPEILGWVGRLANDLKHYARVAAKVDGISIDKPGMPSVQTLFVPLIRNKADEKMRGVLSYIVVNELIHKRPLSLDEAALLFTCRLVAKSTQVSISAGEAWGAYYPELVCLIQENRDNFLEKLRPLLHQYLKIPLETTWELRDLELISPGSDLYLDLEKGALHRRGKPILQDYTDLLFKKNNQLLARFHLSPDSVQFFYDGEKTCSTDQKWKISHSYGEIGTILQKIRMESIEDSFRYIYGINDYEGLQLRGIRSLFESDAFFNTHYQYWRSSKDNDLFFVRQDNSDFAYYYRITGGPILQLKENKEGIWEKTGKILLNLISPATDLEKHWAERLGPLFGTMNLRCTAQSTPDGSAARLEKIEHLALGLSFTLDQSDHWIFDEDPEYFLAEEKSLEVLHGFRGVILLKNKKGEMRILMPAFSFKVGDKNNAFNQKDLIDHSKLCDPSLPYFECTLDENRGLVCQGAESNLYLALLYRSLGDYQRAFDYLQRCKTHESLSPASLAIALQALKRKINSPLGAAFDMKLDFYLSEYQKKWTLHTKPLLIDKEWKKWIVEMQIPLYKNSVSDYKSGVSILPAYCRVSADELTDSGKFHIDRDKDEALTPDERLEKISSLAGTVYNKSNYGWRDRANQICRFCENNIVVEGRISHTWRIYDKRCQKGAGFTYLYEFFPKLMKEAISGEPLRVQKLRQKLFALLMNDPYPVEYLYELISILLYASHYPELYSDFRNKIMSMNSSTCIADAGEVMEMNKERLQFVKLSLVEFQPFSTAESSRQTLSDDLPANPVEFAINPVREETECKHPLKSIVQVCFSRETRAIAQGEFALDATFLETATSLEKHLFKQYRRGHEENKKKTKVVYTVNPGITLEQIRTLLKEQKRKDLERLTELKKTLMQLANRSVRRGQGDQTTKESQAEVYNLLLSRASENHLIITLSDLFTAFLQQKPSLLTDKNPLLTQEDISEIFSELSNYALLSSRVAQINKAVDDMGTHVEFSELEAYQVQLLGETLDKTRSYVIAEFPEFLVYEYMTKRILRQDQVETLTKIIALIEKDASETDEYHHALLQFAAGGGKTSVLLPILANRFARKGFLPVIFNTDELYKTGLKDIPKNLRESLEQNMEVLERDLDHQWDEMEVLKLRYDLERWKKEGKCLLMRPVTWHSLNIAGKIAAQQGNGRLARNVEQVLNFFKHETVKLEDESQIISDANQQAIKSYNKPQKIPQFQLDLILRFYDYLMGYESGSAEIARLAGIKTKDKHTISPANLILLQKKLGQAIILEPCFASCDKTLLLDYLTKADPARPSWLLILCNNEKDLALAEQIVLARSIIQSHLPFILGLQDKKDYGVSIHQGDLTAAPKNEGKDVSRHFGDHTLVACLTVQMMEQNGLTPTQVEQLLLAVRDEHRKERLWNPNVALRTRAEEWLKQFNAHGYSIRTIRDLTPACCARLAADPHFYKHSKVVKKFLLDFALPQITVPTQRETSTPAEMQAGFKRSLCVSATPGLPETYPAYLPRKNCFLEESFEAQVIDTLLSLKNSSHCIMKPTETPTEFFESLPAEVLESCTTLIDRGGLLVDFDGEEVIRSYLGLNESKKRATHTGVFFSKDKTHLQIHGKKRIDIPGTGLIEELKKRKIKPEEFLLFLFMDLSKTTGIDIKRPFKDKAGLTFGKEQTVTETIQAAMRQRQLLEDDAQTVTWIMFETLYREINPKAEAGYFDAREIVYWLIRNEAKQTRSRIIARAYQGLEQEVTALAWEAWKNDPAGFPDQYKKNLQQFQSISPLVLYELDSTEEVASKVLIKYRDDLLSRFGYKINDPRIPKQVQQRIQKIIDETAALIEKLHTPAKVQINNEIQQEMQVEAVQKEEKEITQTLKKNIESGVDYEFNIEVMSGNTVDEFFNDKVNPLILPGCESIRAPTLWFNQNNFRVLRPLNSQDTPAFDQLKPVKMLLVRINPDNTKDYRACTAIEADYYSLILKSSSLSSGSPSYAIISSDGEVFSYSNNTSLSACSEWVKEEATLKMLTFAQFLSGQITNPIIFSQLVKELGWSKQDYESMVNTLSPMLVSTVRPNIANNAAFYSLCGWGETPSQPEDYQAPSDETQSTDLEEVLQPVRSLEKYPGHVENPPAAPKRALEDYLFNTVFVKAEPTVTSPLSLTIKKEKEPVKQAGASSSQTVVAEVAAVETPLTQAQARHKLLLEDVEAQNKEAPAEDSELKQLYFSCLIALNNARRPLIYNNVDEANKAMDEFITNQFIPYKLAIQEGRTLAETQRPAFDKLLVQFMNLKGRIYVECEPKDISHEISMLIQKGDQKIAEIHTAFQVKPRAVEYKCHELQNIIKTIEEKYLPPPPPKRPPSKFW